jgi:hypothetical protein
MISSVAALFFSAALSQAPASGAPPIGTPPIDAGAVWKPPADFRETVAKACAKASDFGACFVERMRAARASPAAIDFARRTGNQGYATAYRDTGRVDVVHAEYPFRANENALVFLVNGQPDMIDVDDLSRIDKKNLESNATYASLLDKFPALAVFPSDRRAGRTTAAGKGRDGGERFVLLYLLKDGCHACEIVADARIGFEFDAEGKFVGTDVVRVRRRGQF